MSPPNERELRFVAYLQSLVDEEDRAALAALRRGLGVRPGAAVEQHRYVVPWAPSTGPRWHEDVYYLVAALFATHPSSWRSTEHDESPNFGASFRRLADATQSASVEKRFIALLGAHVDDVAEHLRHTISLLKAHGVPVSWAQLLHDLRDWSHPDRFVQRDWARAFWRGPAGSGGPSRTEESALPAG